MFDLVINAPLEFVYLYPDEKTQNKIKNEKEREH